MRLSVVSALTSGAVFLPIIANAQTLQNTLALISSFLNAIVYLLITGAIIVFFWGLIKYLSGGMEDKAKGLNIMIMGIVAIFVMVSIWGIIRLLQNTFRVTSTDPVIPKTIQLGGFQ